MRIWLDNADNIIFTVHLSEVQPSPQPLMRKGFFLKQFPFRQNNISKMFWMDLWLHLVQSHHDWKHSSLKIALDCQDSSTYHYHLAWPLGNLTLVNVSAHIYTCPCISLLAYWVQYNSISKFLVRAFIWIWENLTNWCIWKMCITGLSICLLWLSIRILKCCKSRMGTAIVCQMYN